LVGGQWAGLDRNQYSYKVVRIMSKMQFQYQIPFTTHAKIPQKD